MLRIVTLSCLLCTLLLCAQSEANLTSKLLQDTTTCPTWTYWEQSKQACVCADDKRRIVSCDDSRSCYIVRISQWYCMTLDTTMTREVIGACRFSLRSSRRLIPRNSGSNWCMSFLSQIIKALDSKELVTSSKLYV